MTADADAICREYEAGASLATVGSRHGICAKRVRAILVEHGVAIRGPNRTPPAKRTAAIADAADQRVREIAAMIVAGISDRHVIHRHGEKEGWGVTIQTVDGYLERARALLREQTAAEIEDLRALARARFEALWREAEDPKTRLSVLAERNKFEGLNAPAKMEHSGSGGEAIVIYLPDNTRDPAPVPE